MWPVWRIVRAGMTTIEEVDRHWWIDDVLDANEALDLSEEIDVWRRGG